MTPVVKGYPPNFLEIVRRLPAVCGRQVIFAFGDTIYDPTGRALPSELRAHEEVHCRRQLAHPGGVAAWWVRYLADADFRLAEEIPAHRVEYLSLACHVGSRARERYLQRTADKLCAPLYGSLITRERAIEEILKP